MLSPRLVWLYVWLAGCLTLSVARAEDAFEVLPSEIDGVPKYQMMRHYLLSVADQQFETWRKQYDARKTSEQVAEYQASMKAKFIESIGGLPERTPLNAKTTSTVAREGYAVENVLFESQPDHFVSAALFLPDSAMHKRPCPGALVVCGHSAEGKNYEKYQKTAALLALNGIAALIVDPIHQGERYQLLADDGSITIRGCTEGHTLLGLQAILLGWNTARFQIWDNMRAIDYLQSRPGVDGSKIGCMGNSGGGTQTSYMMALDDRIAAAAPSCYITSFERLLNTIGPQDAEQNIYGQLAFGMDHADYLMMRAPMPTLICCATRDFFDIDGAWKSYRDAKRLFGRLGFAERMDIVEVDEKHGYNQPLREASARFMLRWLAGRDEPVTEPEIQLLSDEELRSSARGQVMRIEGAVNGFDLCRAENQRLASTRRGAWRETPVESLRDRVRQIAGIRLASQPPRVSFEKEITVDGVRYRKLALEVEEGVYLPIVATSTDDRRNAKSPVRLLLMDKGKASALKSEAIQQAIREGEPIVAVDLRGVGETFGKGSRWYSGRFGSDSKDIATAYLLGLNYVGMRANDTLRCTDWIREEFGDDVAIHLSAHGHLCAPALHAAYVEPDRFAHVRLTGGLISWSNLIETPIHQNQFVNVVHGALRAYDLPDLAKALGDKVEIVSPLDAAGKPIDNQSE
jgi:cephalosporin-C deacetylase-like acetyl esterase